MNIKKVRCLSGNALKILACITMAIDHVGFLFFPYDMIYRIIGRLAFPIFAFLLAEGCRYTRNKLKHFLTLFVLTVICQVGYYLFSGDTYLCILVTLCLSQICIYALQYFKRKMLDDSTVTKKLLSVALLLGAISFTAAFCRLFVVEYGFWGVMLPVVVSLFDFKKIIPESKTSNEPETETINASELTPPKPSKRAAIRTFLKKLDNPLTQYACFAIGLVMAVINSKTTLPQEYALLSLIPIAFYSGKRGKLNLKYAFYIFYPLHLVIIEAVYIFLYIL